MSISKISNNEIKEFLHENQPDVPAKSSLETKRFFDALSVNVLIPKLNELATEFNKVSPELERVQEISETASESAKKCDDATKSANEAANTLKVTAEEIRSGGFVEALKEINKGRKFKFWIGTHEEYEEDVANGVNFTDTFCAFEDDTSEEIIDGKNFDAELDRIYKAMSENTVRHIAVNTGEDDTVGIGGGSIVHMTIYKVSDTHGAIRAIEYTNLYETALEWTRSLTNGTWHSWCWVNPPCEVGVEYKTTEMWNGSSVYTMVVDCGAVPSNATRSFPHEIENLSSVLRRAGHTDRGAALPFYQDKDIFIQISVGKNIVIVSTGFFDSLKAYVQLWYTKTTNN